MIFTGYPRSRRGKRNGDAAKGLGDSFSSLAATFKTSVGELRTLNPTVNAGTLDVGQRLRVPR